MLATQVSYWQNVEQKRHNLATERLEQQSQSLKEQDIEVNRQNATTNRMNARINARNASVNEINAETNKANSNINSVNALTNISQYELQRELGRSNLAVNQGNLELQGVIADRNYELGLLTNQVQQRQAAASESQARASQAQAAAAQSQARSASALATANVGLINSKTAYQNLENDWYTVNNAAALGTSVVKELPVVGKFTEKLLSKVKKKGR